MSAGAPPPLKAKRSSRQTCGRRQASQKPSPPTSPSTLKSCFSAAVVRILQFCLLTPLVRLFSLDFRGIELRAQVGLLDLGFRELRVGGVVRGLDVEQHSARRELPSAL